MGDGGETAYKVQLASMNQGTDVRDSRSCWRANDLQRIGIPVIVRRIFLWVLSNNINSACVRDHTSNP